MDSQIQKELKKIDKFENEVVFILQERKNFITEKVNTIKKQLKNFDITDFEIFIGIERFSIQIKIAEEKSNDKTLKKLDTATKDKVWIKGQGKYYVNYNYTGELQIY